MKDNNIVNYDDEYLMDDMEYILEENNSIKKIYALNSNSNSISYNISNIKIAENYVSNYIDTNKRLPAVVNIEEHNVNKNDFLYLMCKSLNSTNKVQIGSSFTHVTSNTGTTFSGYKFNKTEYLLFASSIVRYYNIQGHNPYNTNHQGKNLTFDDTVYLYSRILRYQYSHNSLCSYGQVIRLQKEDYSNTVNAQYSHTKQPFTININTKQLNNGKINITFTSSQNAKIYYTTKEAHQQKTVHYTQKHSQ